MPPYLIGVDRPEEYQRYLYRGGVVCEQPLRQPLAPRMSKRVLLAPPCVPEGLCEDMLRGGLQGGLNPYRNHARYGHIRGRPRAAEGGGGGVTQFGSAAETVVTLASSGRHEASLQPEALKRTAT